MNKSEAITIMADSIGKSFCKSVTRSDVLNTIELCSKKFKEHNNRCRTQLYMASMDAWEGYNGDEPEDYDFCYGVVGETKHDFSVFDYTIADFLGGVPKDLYSMVNDDDWSRDDFYKVMEKTLDPIANHLRSLGIYVRTIRTMNNALDIYIDIEKSQSNTGNDTPKIYIQDLTKSGKEKWQIRGQPQKVVQDFIYRINEQSNKIKITIPSGDYFFDTTNTAEDTLCLYAIGISDPIMKIEKKVFPEEVRYKFIVDINTEDGEGFSLKCYIDNETQLENLIRQTIESLKTYPQFYKYAEDLENCL